MGQPQTRTERYTYADYLTWPEDTRYELIDGVAYAMAPAPTRSHQLVTGELFRQISTALKGGRCQTFVAPFDLRLPRADEADALVDTVVQPDVLVVFDPARVDERGVRGAPDWVAEVLSPASAGRDHGSSASPTIHGGVSETKRQPGAEGPAQSRGEEAPPFDGGATHQTVKLAAYERAGVPEVWLLHPTDRVLTVYRLEGQRYGRPQILEMQGQVPLDVLPEAIVDFDLFTE